MAGQGFERVGQQQAADFAPDARAIRHRSGNELAHLGFDLRRVFLGVHAPIQLQHHFVEKMLVIQ